ncbi:MAG: transcriptional regulator [Lysobacteraceae bacterium]|nr:MAG: transcriptional regulator [Xanthomonadaceae bacterium]
MDKEKAAFAKRLRDALDARGIEASPAVLEKRFNSRYGGSAVTAQAISGWLNGKAIPKQDKLRVLAGILGLEPHELQFGGRAAVGEGKADWSQSLGGPDRAMLDAYLSLPTTQRKLVRDLVASLARAYEIAG